MTSEQRRVETRAQWGAASIPFALGLAWLGVAACGGQVVSYVDRPGQGEEIDPLPSDGTGGDDDDTSAEGGTRPSPGRPATGLFQSAGTFVGLFPASGGAYVVHSEGVTLVDASGAVRKSWQSPREVTAAAFDGVTLGVADKSMLHALDLDLEESASIDLVEECASGVMLSSARFVCGPENDWDRIFYVYDLAAGAYLGASDKHTYNGIPMKRVPGTDDFITVTTDLSPSDYHLYRVDGANVVTYAGESPYHGDFSVHDVYAFAGVPAHHLVTVEGLFLRLDESGGPTPTPLMKDGALGTLRGAERFAALDQNADGTEIQALVTTSNGWGGQEENTSYDLQRIDVPGRVVVSRRSYALPGSRILSLRGDAEAAWVAVPISDDPWDPQGFSVSRLSY